MANVTYTVPNKSGSYDGDMVVKQYTSMIIDAGDTVTTDQPCRGLLILVQGNCTINGTLSMKARGAFANPTTGGGSDGNPVDSNGLRLPFLTSGGSSTLTASGSLFNGCGNDALSVIANFKTISGNGDILQVTRTGAGNTTQYSGSSGSRNKFTNGTSGTNHLGGGGEGSVGYGSFGSTGKSATCFSGGSAGGGRQSAGGTDTTGGDYGGQGGLGRSGHTARCTGGAGNPNGNETTNGSYGGASNSSNGESGTGGSIWLIVGGNLTIGASGLITVQGSRSDSINGNGYEWCSTGGGSGGGSIKIAYKGTFTNNGTINVNGGLAGIPFNDGAGNYSSEGGNGGNGTYTALQVS